jgi:glucokinase
MSDQQLLDAIDAVTARLKAGPAQPSGRESGAELEALRLMRAAGWIEVQGSELALSGRRGAVIGLDLGGTKLRGAIGDAAGEIVIEFDEQTANDAKDATLAQMADMARSLAARAGIALEAIEHVAVGVPGIVAPDGGVALSPNVSFDRNTPLAETLSKMLSLPVSVDNDGNLSAFGEYTAGRGRDRGTHSLAFLALGTGIGMGLIVDGHLLHGNSGGAGEIALLPFGADPFSSARLHPGGAYEAAVGTDGIRRAYAQASGHELEVREIFDRAQAGDAAATAVVADVTRNIALGVATVIALLDPGVVVVGGGIGARPGFAEAIGALTAQLVSTACAVVPSALGDRAGVVGAVQFACREARLRLIEGTASTARGAAA